MRKLLFICLLSLALWGCSKGGMNASKLAGEYELYKYELRYFNGDDSQDSTFTAEDVAHMGLFDQGSTVFNYVTYSSSSVPRSWMDYGVGIPTKWYSDDGRGNTITFSTDVGQFVIYDVEKDGRNKYKWTCVVTTTSGGVNYIETVYVEKK